MTVFLGGDVMPGRGVDQILPHPGDPHLWEPHARDARTYVELAERANGAIGRPVEFAWPWGEALRILDDAAPDVRVINLETSITSRSAADPGKAVHYRMSPRNAGCLRAARPDVCALANNHVLDFGYAGLEETRDTLARARIRATGAGADECDAGRPAAVPVGDGARVVVFSLGAVSSGIPPAWAAAPDRPGVDFLPDLTDRTAAEVTARVRRAKRPGDVVVVSLHWGSNWGYAVPAEQERFAHRLVDGGVDVVHGHSSHHPRPIEVYDGRLVLYGCGDLLDDYEGIGGHDEYRPDLRLLYFARVRPDTGALASLRMAPVRARRMRLEHAGEDDAVHLRQVLARISRRFGSLVDLDPDGTLSVRTRPGSPAAP